MYKIGLVGTYGAGKTSIAHELYCKIEAYQWVRGWIIPKTYHIGTSLLSATTKEKVGAIDDGTFRTQKKIFHTQFRDEYLSSHSVHINIFDGTPLNNLIHICLNHSDDPQYNEWLPIATELVVEHLNAYTFLFFIRRPSVNVLNKNTGNYALVEDMILNFLKEHKVRHFKFVSVNEIMKKVQRHQSSVTQ